jgi:glycogen synthase
VTRLVHQKGIHLIKHAAWRTLERGGQFVLLGSAPDPKVQVGRAQLVLINDAHEMYAVAVAVAVGALLLYGHQAGTRPR